MQTKYKLNHSLFIFGLMILFFIAAFPLVQAQTAAPGDLDTTFGSGGKVVTAITSDNDYPTRVRIQPDGKIVTVGIVQNAALKLTATFVVRHNANGSVDTSFGRNGSFIAQCCDDAFSSPVFYDFVVQPDGKLLLTGGAYSGNFYYGAYTIRLNANGTLDNTFGYNSGTFTVLDGVGDNIALQADGKIVVLGSTFSSPNRADKVVLFRYNANGTLDTSFGAGGEVITTVGTNLINNRELLIQPDGKILAAGHANFSGNINAYVARYNIDGTLDTGFGTNGIASVDINNNFNKVGRMALQPDGKIVVNGENFNNPSRNSAGNAVISSSIFRLDANGAVDTTFGTNGFVIIPAANGNEGVGKTLALQQNGKILTAGLRSGTFSTLRYNSNGTIDNSFGSNGVVTTVVGSNPGADGIASLAVQPDGKIVATGGVKDASNRFDVGLVRYLGDAVTTTTRRTLFDFDGDGKADVSVFRPDNGVWYLQQSQAGFTGIEFGQSTHKLGSVDIWYKLKKCQL